MFLSQWHSAWVEHKAPQLPTGAQATLTPLRACERLLDVDNVPRSRDLQRPMLVAAYRDAPLHEPFERPFAAEWPWNVRPLVLLPATQEPVDVHRAERRLLELLKEQLLKLMDDAAQLPDPMQDRWACEELRELFRRVLPFPVQPKLVTVRLKGAPP